MLCAIVELESDRQPFALRYDKKTKETTVGLMQLLPKNAEWLISQYSFHVPGLRIPKPVEFSEFLGSHLPQTLVERLSALRIHIVVMAGQEAPTITRSRRKSATKHVGSTLADLQQALEDYLPVLLGLVKDGSDLQRKVTFVWINQEDDAEVCLFKLQTLSTLLKEFFEHFAYRP